MASLDARVAVRADASLVVAAAPAAIAASAYRARTASCVEAELGTWGAEWRTTVLICCLAWRGSSARNLGVRSGGAGGARRVARRQADGDPNAVDEVAARSSNDRVLVDLGRDAGLVERDPVVPVANLC